MAIHVGAQLNCWPLAPDFDAELVRAIREAGEIGYAGVETNWRVSQVWAERRDELGGLLRDAGVALAALFYIVGTPADAAAAREEVDHALSAAAFARALGATHMMVGGGKTTDDPAVFRAACDHYNTLGQAVYEAHGIKACYHLHAGGIAASPDEIARMMDLTDERYWFLCPDSGIMVKAGHDLVATIERFFPRIAYLHFKDYDGAEGWTMLGEGVVDHAGALAKLDALGYDGWVVSENESRRADLTPKEQQGADREQLRAWGV
jgi:sugar phosphate isomerase/epimerase